MNCGRHLAMDQHVIRRDARLPRVDELAPGDARGGHVDVGALVDQARALAAEFQRHRRQVPGRRRHHDARHALVSRVENVVELLLEQLGRLGNAALDHGERVGVEIARDDPRQRRGSVRRDFRRLHDRAVARGHRAHQRRHHHRHRVVPRRDDQHHALRLGLDVAPARLRHQRRAHALCRHPFVEVLARVLRLGLDETQLRQHRLEPALAEVGLQRLHEVGLVVPQHAVDLGELVQPPLEGPRLAAVERLAQTGQRRRDGGVHPGAPAVNLHVWPTTLSQGRPFWCVAADRPGVAARNPRIGL